MAIKQEIFGSLPDGQIAERFILSNDRGMEVHLSNYGGIVMALSVPDRAGEPADVVLGYDSLAEYLHFTPYFGATIGRFAGPLRQARFELDGRDYVLPANEGPHHLHGGRRGFDKVLWAATPFQSNGEVGVRLAYVSPDGEEGYPGTVSVTLTYTVGAANELKLDYEATTDRPTFVNFTHHGYFNLAGQGRGDIREHHCQFAARRFHAIDRDLVPTGAVLPVEGTPFDFTRMTRLGDRLESDHEQVRLAGGFDQNWIRDKIDGSLQTLACVRHPASGRRMEMDTTEPGFQFYTSNILADGTAGKAGRKYGKWSAFCLEAQRFPAAPETAVAPGHILRPGGRYIQHTRYRFGVE